MKKKTAKKVSRRRARAVSAPKKLRDRMLEKYFPFRPLDTLTKRELKNFDLNVWRKVELMRSDMSGMSAEAQEEFLNVCYRSIQFGFESHYEHSEPQSKRAKKRHKADYAARERALSLAQEFRNTKPTERIGEGANYVAAGLRDEGFGNFTDRAIRGWIAELFPDGLRNPGRPTKK